MSDLISAIGVGAVLAGGIKYFGEFRVRVHSIRSAARLIAAEIEAHALMERNANFRGFLANRITAMEAGETYTWAKSAMPAIDLDPFFNQQSTWVGYFPPELATRLVLYENYKVAVRLTFQNLSDGVNASFPGGTLQHLRGLASIYDLASPIGQKLIIDLRIFAERYGKLAAFLNKQP